MPANIRFHPLSLLAALFVAAVARPAFGRHLPDEVMVRFQPGTPAEEQARIITGAGGKEKDSVPRLRLKLVKIPPGQGVAATIERLKRNPNVQSAEPNMRLYPKGLPDDPYLDKQWSLEQIGAILAWGMTVTGAEGSSAVTIAVVDAGILSSHPDLAGKLVAGYNAIDDSNNAEPDAGEDHGTFVGSIAAANTDNGKGIAGTAQLAKLMPVKIGMDEFSIIKGALTAVERGARVVNMSLGSCSQECATCPVECEPPSEAGAEAALTAYGDGAVLVAAAGNESTTMTSYPAGYPYVLGVSATGPSGTLADYSNRGPQVDVAAPGGGGSYDCHNSVDVIGATDPTHACPAWLFQDLRTMAGTSMSAPHVAGLAAVLFGQNPSRTNDEVIGLIRSTAYQPEGATGWNDSYGYGRIDMNGALTAVAPAPFAGLSVSVAVSPAVPAVGATLTVTSTVHNTGSGDAAEVVPELKVTAGESLVNSVASPAPAMVTTGGTAVFVWTFSATGAGTVGLTTVARGTDRRTGAVVKASANLGFQIVAAGALRASLSLDPAAPTTGRAFRAVLSVTNTGSAPVKLVIPAIQANRGGGMLIRQGAPSDGPADLGPATTRSFTWTFQPSGSGPVSLTATTEGRRPDNGAVVLAAVTVDFTVLPVSDQVMARVAPGHALAAPNVLDLSDPAGRVVIVMRGTGTAATANLAIYDAMGGLVRKGGVPIDYTGWGVAYVTAGDNLAPGVYWALVTGAGIDERKPFKVVARRKP